MILTAPFSVIGQVNHSLRPSSPNIQVEANTLNS